jgi:tetratricopeptide (TPR) repeat protein
VSATKSPPSAPLSPWRSIFEAVRESVGSERDEHGVLGSINWLRHQMETRGANPNVVRNIIYRDKGKLPDKRVLFEILDELWRSRGKGPLRSPELEVLLAPGSGNDQEILQLLGREKRRAYRTFVQAVRSGGSPRLVVVGKPGSGKTLLSDYIQQALEIVPPAADRIVRLEFSGTDLATSLARLGARLGAPSEVLQAKLVRVGASSAFAVQADAQADVARTIVDAARAFAGRQVVLLHVSQSLGGQESLGLSPLRLNTPDVPRVSAAEWLWVSLVEPLTRLPDTSLLVSMTDLPLRAQQRLGDFEGPVRLTPPTAGEARRFVRARLPNATPAQHEEIVQRAGRSFEELRTLTLLAEIRDPDADAAAASAEQSVTQLSNLLDASGDERLRGFLAALAVLSLPDFTSFPRGVLAQVRPPEHHELSNLEGAFLDVVAGRRDDVRCFSRQLARALRDRLQVAQPARYRELNRRAAGAYHAAATGDPQGETATRYLAHLFEARDWEALASWMHDHPTQQALVRRLWLAATQELVDGPRLERLAVEVAGHYVTLGTYQHPDVRDAFAVLAASADVDARAWTVLKRTEGLTLRGQYEAAAELLATLPETRDPVLRAEAALARASIERWQGRLDAAHALVERDALAALDDAPPSADADAVRAKAGLWAGLIAKDGGDLDGALAAFDAIPRANDLDAARVAFQRGDVFMKLGHFDRALRAMNTAVTLARRSEALVTEQTRYLARRGTVHRRLGDLARAFEDFEEARRVLLTVRPDPERRRDAADEADRDFWLARVDDERGLAALAAGRFDEALLAFATNLDRFERFAATQHVDATYRLLRSRLRLALAYGCRALGQPFRRPFAISSALDGTSPDLRHARALIEGVLGHLEAHPMGARYATLTRETLFAGNLFAADGAASLAYAERALVDARYPYQRAQAHAHAALGALRHHDADLAERHVAEARRALAETTLGVASEERGDLELEAWLITLDALAAVERGDLDEAVERLAGGLTRVDLGRYQVALLHQFGCAVEEHGLDERLAADRLAARAPFAVGDLLGALRLADALVAGWSRRPAAVPVAGAATEGRGDLEGVAA